MGIPNREEGASRRRMRAVEAEKELADLVNKEFVVDVTPAMIRSLIANNWPDLSLYAHIIHRDIEKGYRP